MTAILLIALVFSWAQILLQRVEIKQLEAEHDRLCDLLAEDRP